VGEGIGTRDSSAKNKKVAQRTANTIRTDAPALAGTENKRIGTNDPLGRSRPAKGRKHKREGQLTHEGRESQGPVT